MSRPPRTDPDTSPDALAADPTLRRVVPTRSPARASRRVAYGAAIAARLGVAGRVRGYAVDLTPTGVGLFSPVRLQAGDTLELEIEPPTGGTAIAFTARVAWCEQRDSGPWRAGLVLVDGAEHADFDRAVEHLFRRTTP